MGRTLEHQMLDHLVGAVAVWTDGRVPAPDTVEVSCYQWGMSGEGLTNDQCVLVPPSRTGPWANPVACRGPRNDAYYLGLAGQSHRSDLVILA